MVGDRRPRLAGPRRQVGHQHRVFQFVGKRGSGAERAGLGGRSVPRGAELRSKAPRALSTCAAPVRARAMQRSRWQSQQITRKQEFERAPRLAADESRARRRATASCNCVIDAGIRQAQMRLAACGRNRGPACNATWARPSARRRSPSCWSPWREHVDPGVERAVGQAPAPRGRAPPAPAREVAPRARIPRGAARIRRSTPARSRPAPRAAPRSTAQMNRFCASFSIGAHQRGRQHQPAEPPAGHAEVLREAVDRDHVASGQSWRVHSCRSASS